MPPRGTIADFPPVFAGQGRGNPRLRRALRPRRRLLAAGLAVAAAGATVTAARTTAPGEPPDSPAGRDTPQVTRRAAAGPQPGADPKPASQAGSASVSAPVRIADAAAVRLLRPGDRVDVIATGPPGPVGSSRGGSARVVARHVLVEQVPDGGPAAARDLSGQHVLTPDGTPPGGALVVLKVSRRTATELAGAAASSALAVTLC